MGNGLCLDICILCCEELKITSLCFADDLLILSNGDVNSVKVIKGIIKEFTEVSGLYLNMIKRVMFYSNDEERFGKLSDDDAIRLCILLSLEIWILETFERCESWWIKDPKVIPRALGWSKKSLFTRSDYSCLFAKVSSIGGTSDNSVKKKWLNDLVIMELNYRVFKLETIIQVLAHERNDRQRKLQFTDAFRCMTSDLSDSLNSMFNYLREEELRLCLEAEEMLRCEHEKLIIEDNRFRSDEANRLKLEEKNMLQLEEQKKNKRKEFMNSSHGKNILAKLAPGKRNQLGSSLEKINSKVSQPGQVKCKFPWNDDYTVDRNFWLKLVCLDPARKGWLTEELMCRCQPGQVKCKFPWNDDYTVDRNFWLKLVCLDPARKGWLTEEVNMDTPNQELIFYVYSCDELALIRCIFFVGYGV
ncbi:hypothetical protein Tco_0678824 [Tanacetum coccineum]|uniref:Reverse transcriptase domain-containing protein n=1 Tax=Tanacetum coccineum TaxID=301880 RepID=A0ABQ4XG53_9ASTR